MKVNGVINKDKSLRETSFFVGRNEIAILLRGMIDGASNWSTKECEVNAYCVIFHSS